jgi:hypothetical protein
MIAVDFEGLVFPNVPLRDFLDEEKPVEKSTKHSRTIA